MNLFLDRVASFPSSTFILLNVQALPGDNQEAIVNFISRPDISEHTFNLHCVQLSDTILHSSPWVEQIIWNEKRLKDTALDTLKAYVTDKVHIEDIVVVASSSPGGGKTRLIRKEMERLQREDQELNIISVCIHEGTTLDSLVRSLKVHQTHEACRNAIHFSFMLPLEKCDTNLIKSLNHFFNNFLLTRSVHSPVSGETFVMGWSKWNIFIEIQGINTHNKPEDFTMQVLNRYIPILSFCATIQKPPREYDVDEKTLRVCTYLRAFSDGTIDRKFEANANKQLLFVIDDSGSMEIMLDHRTAFRVAVDNALNIFDSHIHDGDFFGTIIFNTHARVHIPLEEVRDGASKQRLRDVLRNSPCIGAGTEMYRGLNLALRELQRSNNQRESWIVCLTDGESGRSEFEAFQRDLSYSSPELQLLVVGVNLHAQYEDHLRYVCSKFGTAPTQGGFIPSQANVNAMDHAFGQVAARIPVSQTFELDGALTNNDCWDLIGNYLPDFVSDDDMLHRKFWIEFLYRRVKVFDDNEDFNYNETHDALGSSLMKIMLYEAEQLLSTKHSKNWKDSNHEQLIYDFTEPNAPEFRLICTAPDLMNEESIDRYKSLDLPGFYIPTTAQLRHRSTLDCFLSQALNVPLSSGEDGAKRLACIDDNKFVLTLDFAMKMLNMHERVACRIPCVIEGETGVSKTKLTSMYSILRNSSLNEKAREETLSALRSVSMALQDLGLLESDDGEGASSFEIIHKGLVDSTDGMMSSKTEIGHGLHRLMLEYCDKRASIFQDVPERFKSACDGETITVLDMLKWFSESVLEQTFFELNVDASLKECDVKEFFHIVCKTAHKVAASGAMVVVFLDGK